MRIISVQTKKTFYYYIYRRFAEKMSNGFAERRQYINENIYLFAASLKQLAKSAYPELDEYLLEKYVMDQLIEGIANKHIKVLLKVKRAQLHSLDDVMQLAASYEEALSDTQPTAEKAEKTITTTINNHDNNKPLKCYNCHTYGHLSRDCRAPRLQNNNTQQRVDQRQRQYNSNNVNYNQPQHRIT